MNARKLVTAIHKIDISTEFAVTARASEEADTDALTNRPTLHARAKGIDPPDHFVPRGARPDDWKGSFHRAGIRVADTGRLDPNAHLTGPGSTSSFTTSSNSPGFVTWIALYVALIPPPYRLR